eukprot:9391306-Alexandrium_andersonii.AAC.1
MTPNPRTRPFEVEFEAMLGLRAWSTDCGLRTDCRSPPASALTGLAECGVLLRPGKLCTRPEGYPGQTVQKSVPA